jgi:hypothetical protein
MADDAVSTRSTFDWDAVPLDLLRALVASAASRDEKAHVAAASPEQLIDAASRSFGQRGATSRDARAGALVLREQWLPTATPESVHAIYGQLSHPRTAATPADQQAFLAIRKLNEGYRTLLWHHFRAEHRHARPAARARTSNVRRDPRGFFDLQGAGADPRELWPHQVAVHRALDERTFGRKAPGALVVLPTGAGKTRTAVTWLLRLLVESPESRVVWVAHQVELVEQAERAFIESAQECPIGWSARVRVIATNRGGGGRSGGATRRSLWRRGSRWRPGTAARGPTLYAPSSETTGCWSSTRRTTLEQVAIRRSSRLCPARRVLDCSV